MMKIKKTIGKIIDVTDLSKTAKEVKISLVEPLDFIAGSFVNIFMEIGGQKVRRAFSISSTPKDQMNITLAIRLNPKGGMTPIFWNKDMVGETIEIMGPLGLNTVDKMQRNKVYLFAFGVGAGVVKSIAEYYSSKPNITNLTIMTGSKYEDEILYKEYFDELSRDRKNITTMHIVSRPENRSIVPKGYIQDHISTFDFSHSDIYLCGQESACNDLVEKIKLTNPTDLSFFIEGFH
ncbi:MAG: FAD-binding oxidoreductase [Patescibacteria group bacterium]